MQPALKRYVDNTYTKHLSTSGRIDIMKRWIHFYSTEDFTKEETLLEIEDYSPTHPEEKEKKDSDVPRVELKYTRTLNMNI